MMEFFKFCDQITRKEVELKIRFLEYKYGFKAPPIFSSFYMTYQVGQFTEYFGSYLDEYLRPFPMNDIEIRSENRVLFYEWLCSMNEIELSLKYYPKSAEILQDKQLLRMGSTLFTTGLFVGVGDQNSDKIFIFDYEVSDEPICLFENIYNLINKTILIRKHFEFTLEKAFTDKYWRIKNNHFLIRQHAITNLNDLSEEIESIDVLVEFIDKNLKYVQSKYL